MALRTREDPFAAERAELLSEIRGLRKDLSDASKERDELRDRTRLEGEITSLKKQVADLEIRRGKLTEDHEREKREVTHMVGLERKRQEFEIDQARRETTVSVREENLAADRKRFEDQMKFTTERFESEVGYLKGLMGEVLDRLPHVTVDKPAPARGRRGAGGE
jgi:chromosome segregation ATPase